ncbi:MAG: J domain-containing protein [Archangium sp.]
MPVMKAGGRVQLADVRLQPQETRALNYFDGVRSLAELARDVPAEADVILRTAFLLHPLELVSFADVPGRPPPVSRSPSPPKGTQAAPPRAVVPPAPPQPIAPPRAPTIAPPQAMRPPTVAPPPAGARPPSPYPGGAPPTVAPPPAGARPPSPFPGGAPPTVTSSPSAVASSASRPPMSSSRSTIGSPSGIAAAPRSSGSGLAPMPAPEDLKGLQALLETMKKQTFFEVLGIKKDGDASQVKMAYLKAARSFHPDTVPPDAPPEVAKAKADIFALISEANRTLSDPVLREDYTAELAAGGSGNKVDIEKILRAEDSFQKGTIMVKARKYPEALKMLESAIADNPDEGEFYAWRGYAKFLISTDRKAATPEVLRDINLCVSKNPNVANAYYFLGFVAKLNGDHKTALANFKKCVALDPKHIDASRELRTMK